VSYGGYDAEAETKGGWPWTRFLDDVASASRPITDLADARGDTLGLEQIARACGQG